MTRFSAIIIITFFVTPNIFARPEDWATPIKAEGLPNFYKVSSILYRGAQPSRKGMQNLYNMGIKAVINLRTMHSDKYLIEGLPIKYYEIPIFVGQITEKQILSFLKIVLDPSNHPVFVHCKHGADRTGVMIAIYRVVVQGWTKEEAVKEMTEGGFGFHPIFSHLPTLILELDTKKITEDLNKNLP